MNLPNGVIFPIECNAMTNTKAHTVNTLMKAYARTGSATQEIKLIEVSIPAVEDGTVLIKVEAFGVGIHDRYFIPVDANFPYIVGSEGSGTVAKLGAGVNAFSVGDRVIFTTVLQAQGGSWAEYAIAKKESLILLPEGLTFAEGAAVSIAGKTALESMRELNLNAGDTLFIAGASGAIGTFMIQLAASKGIRVAASASSRNQVYMQKLGAEKPVDYNDPNWINEVTDWSNGGVTAALAIQPGTGLESIQAVKDGGLLITVSGDNATIPQQRNIEIRQMGHQLFTQTEMTALVNSISAGNIKIEIEDAYLFENALDALRKTETRRARGKSIVKIN